MTPEEPAVFVARIESLATRAATPCGGGSMVWRIWGERDAFGGPHLGEYRRVLASVQQDLDFRVIDGAGHWVTYEAADQVTAALLDLLEGGQSDSPGVRRARPARCSPR